MLNSIDEDIQIQLQNEPIRQPQKKRNRYTHNQHLSNPIIIPHITKRMNCVEKYINKFQQAQQYNKLRRSNYLSERIPNNYLEQDSIKHYQSIDASLVESKEETYERNSGSCLAYDSVREKSSEERLESLGKMEKEYLKLKQKMHFPKPLLPNISRTIRNNEQKSNFITPEEVEKQVKKSVITDKTGQKHFADLYLMKKSRDKIINSLSNAAKYTQGSFQAVDYDKIIKNTMNYQNIVAAEKHEFIKKKILMDRGQKKSKMVKGRNLNWNVYYELLALGPRERQRLKGTDKFEIAYGLE